ncbi:unnamed protein product [Fraxinus pennsylvanica]|uniref:Leucine-rich repeat-containing N-terminal plant-type domain-containing protein n=1 Tax=Fraxinus pennsylvanica TaxID=56036 RepID=A0AAD2DPS5_9LAMI|nr:unnamed protein product [Fraxinus pennsylvanica]
MKCFDHAEFVQAVLELVPGIGTRLVLDIVGVIEDDEPAGEEMLVEEDVSSSPSEHEQSLPSSTAFDNPLVSSRPSLDVKKPDGANQIDLEALLAFKDGISDDPFEVLSSWNDSVHFCQWRGVICSTRHQRVTTLNLYHQKLKGSMSSYIGNLSFLHQLVIDNNNFTGKIPQELGGLKRLRILWLRNNSLDVKIHPAFLIALVSWKSSCLETV